MASIPFRSRRCVPFFVLIIAICLISHLTFTNIQNGTATGRFIISRHSSRRHLNISIAVVLGNLSDADEYETALNSIKCYSKIHDYTFHLVQDADYRDLCMQKEFMFRRHCIATHLLEETDWLLFLDADVAVVNPNVLLEEYIDPAYDLTFYDRFVNWEVAAGSYIVKNTSWAKRFLLNFANFESQLPNSFHGTDNGAIHMFLQQTFYPQLSQDARLCRRIWEKAANFRGLFTFEACIRAVMGDVREFDRARILRKGTGWVRDIWLADSKWSPERDFMIHGLKDANKVNILRGFIVNTIYGDFNWRSPFAKQFNLTECISPNSTQWVMNKHLIASKGEIDQYLKQQFDIVEKRRWKSLAAVADYI